MVMAENLQATKLMGSKAVSGFSESFGLEFWLLLMMRSMLQEKNTSSVKEKFERDGGFMALWRKKDHFFRSLLGKIETCWML